MSLGALRLGWMLCLLLLMDVGLFAQTNGLTVKGRVLDAQTREPLIGVTVMERGTNNASVSDYDGNFTLRVAPSATVSFSYVNYVKRELKASQVKGDIFLREDDKTLQEVVVVGYGTQKKANLSGAVTAIDGEKVAAKPSTDVLSALQGEMPGVAILRSSGEPGSETSGLRIRGFSSANSTSTLVLIDGVEGDLSLLNADDVESISVLKDAAAYI